MPSPAVSTFLNQNGLKLKDCRVTNKYGVTHKFTPEPKSTRKHIPQPTSNDFTSYQLGHEKIINANPKYAFINISGNSNPANQKFKLIYITDQKKSRCQIIIGKGEQATIYAGACNILQIITNP